ncbi:MAG: 30S ribosomal protein S5 [Deltaproteobacteria bacterium]|nr:30S ribosomal protein S5 [Deltaproteobacteria bacterium]
MALKDKFDKRRVRRDLVGELTEKTVHINRVAKVVKGGRRFSFSALVVVGDGRGHFGFGLGKAAEVPDAISKAAESARKSLVRVPIRGVTIPHDVIGKFGPSSVVLKPGQPGTGVIAGSVVRAVMDVTGIKDIRTKCLGSTSPQNVLYAVLDGLLKLREPEVTAAMRRVSIDDLGYAPY